MRLIFDEGSFCAFVFYDKAKKELTVTKRDGKQYRFDNISASKFLYLQKSRNKGQYLREKIVEKRTCEYVQTVPLAQVNQVLGLKQHWKELKKPICN